MVNTLVDRAKQVAIVKGLNKNLHRLSAKRLCGGVVQVLDTMLPLKSRPTEYASAWQSVIGSGPTGPTRR